jgi:GNAT superfamily N-acetyltransferase
MTEELTSTTQRLTASSHTEKHAMRIVYLLDRPTEEVAVVAGWFMEQWGPENMEAWLPLIGGMLTHRALPTTFVAIDNEQVVGTASLVASDPGSLPGYSPWLASVYVPPGEQGRGVCAALIRRVEAEARALGFPRLHFQTAGRVEPYERLGWRWVGSRIAGHAPTKVLARDLAPVERAA